MSEMKHIGEDEFELAGATYTIEQEGVVAATATWNLAHNDTYDIDEAQDWGISKVGEAHDIYDHLIATNASVTTNGPFHSISVSYSGIPNDADQSYIKITASMSTEPIDTHPEFMTKIAGRPVRPPATGLNESVWNDDATFKEFKIHPECPRPVGQNKQGVKSYLSPEMTYEVTRVLGKNGGVTTAGDPVDHLEDIGKIFKNGDLEKHTYEGAEQEYPPPKGEAYKKDGKRDGSRDWLLVSCGFKEVGEGKEVTTKYRMSGRFKWNSDMYEEG